MLRFSSVLHSKTFQEGTPFINASLQIMKLHLQHKNILESDKRAAFSPEAKAIEAKFRRDLDEYRAMYTLSSQMEVAKLYSNKVLLALRHFGLRDDPLVRQIEKIQGKRQLERGRGRNLLFKGVQHSDVPNDLAMDNSQSDFDFPSELPATRKYSNSDLPKSMAKVAPKHRGHWVLRDPDIVLSKHERKYDAW